MDNMLKAWRVEMAAVSAAEAETLKEMEAMPDGPVDDGKPKPFDTKVMLGELRGLPTGSCTHKLRLPVVAVLQKWDNRHWLAAPFSPVDTPALRGEFRITDMPWGGAMQVWNAFIIPDLILRKSWNIGRISDEEALQGRFLFRQLVTGVEIPPEHQPVVGPPLTDPKDPRMAYQKAEKEAWRPLRDRIAAYAETSEAWDKCLSSCAGCFEAPDSEYLYLVDPSVLDALAEKSPEVEVYASWYSESADDPFEEVKRMMRAPDNPADRKEWLEGKVVEEVIFDDGTWRHRVMRKPLE